jgi:F0F1-type ATP synthase delta subunit
MEQAIAQLVAQSYTNGQLDHEKAEKIASALSRQQLKEYIRLIKIHESKHFVFVYTAQDLNELQKKDITSYFPKKIITFRVDPDIISGIKIIDYDNVYELSLRQIFNDIREHLIGYD